MAIFKFFQLQWLKLWLGPTTIAAVFLLNLSPVVTTQAQQEDVEPVYANIVFASATGKSLSDDANAITTRSTALSSEEISQYYADEAAIRETISILNSLGFTTIFNDRISVLVSGPKPKFENVFNMKLGKVPFKYVHNKKGGEIRYWQPSKKPSVPKGLSKKIDAVVFPIPSELLQSPPIDPDPLPLSYFHLNVPADISRILHSDVLHEWRITGKDVKVSTIDTGLYMHPYFVSRGYKITQDTVLDNAQTDDQGHGTAVASNLLSIAPGVNLTSIKAVRPKSDNPIEEVYVRTSDAISALSRANENGSQVISFSWGIREEGVLLCREACPGWGIIEALIRVNIDSAISRGAIVVFSAGNGEREWPGSLPEVISVGGVARNTDNTFVAADTASSFTSLLYPFRHVPDVSGLSCLNSNQTFIQMPTQPNSTFDQDQSTIDGTASNDGWAVSCGTSFAAPQVAGIAALIKQVNPSLTQSDVKKILEDTAYDVISGTSAMGETAGPGKDDATGYGLVNAFRAVEEADPVTISIARGLDYLRNTQNIDGSWINSVGITGLASLAFLNYGYQESDPDVQEAVQYLLANAKQDGSIYTDYYHRTYETGIAILPLKATRNDQYTDEIASAKDWLVKSQWDDDSLWGGIEQNNWYWGGFGYGYNTRPDLSNTQFALLALDAADLPESDATWTKALKFVSRCQNFTGDGGNDQWWAGNDGGFIYYPGASLAGGTTSYGSMTGAGIWGNALAGRTPEDPSFAAALKWVENNYSWDYNPKTGGSWGNNALYYYYLSMSKALSMARKTKIGGILGIGAHDWYEDLSDKLVSLQRYDGSWVGYSLDEYYPELATAYSILALQTRQLPLDTDLEMAIILHSPADLHLYDADGRHVGKNYSTGGIDLEIPGSTYSGTEPQTIIIHPPFAGNYHLELVGITEGDWQIEMIGYQDGIQVSYDSYTGSITPGAILATDLNVGAFEGGLTIFSSQPGAAAVMEVEPTSLELSGTPGSTPQALFTVLEIGGGVTIQGISVFASDLTDGSGNVISGGSLTFDPASFDIPAGGSQSVLVTIPLSSDLPDGDYDGFITVESLNAGTKSISISIALTSNVPPSADANGPYEANEGEGITLDASGSSDPDDNITLYEWDLDNDGEYDDASGVTTDVTFGDNGTYTMGLKVTDAYGESDVDSSEVTVYNLDPDLGADPLVQTVQYSDDIVDVTFTATDVANDLPQVTATEWNVDGGGFTAGLPRDLTLTANGCSVSNDTDTCTWTLSGVMSMPAGEYTVSITAEDEDGGVSTSDVIINVLPEDATVAFDENNPVAVKVAEPGGSSGTFSLTVHVNETQPDLATSGSRPGDISNAIISMDLIPVGPGGTVAGICAPATVSGVDYEAILPITCNFNEVPVNAYTVQAVIGGGYYDGYGEDVLVVYDPSLGFTTGGGWFYWPETGERTNFGYTMKYNKKGQNVKGNLLLIRHMPDGSIYRVKSNALYGLAIGDSIGYGWASFSGKSTYLEPGWPEPIGNHEFVVYVEDHNEPGIGVDRFWIEVHDKASSVIEVMSMGREAVDNVVELGGGNIVVPHTPAQQ